jgi:hypothetical protein
MLSSVLNLLLHIGMWRFLFEGVAYVLYAFFWVIPRRLDFICRRFGTLCSIFIGRYVPMKME